ncbi:hypothetical protein [Actinomadura harenae]|uniref:Uncharacterized protein n=1 Tax=Actinomadura harenae TaxID=2483351 RepID=A0A3M2M1C7_9ACTN|nr:hypothetical protein [Actinomadura harenae]RMI43336.1 hypothetical protein EBO15_16815 [Actinomadura harenae]
MNSKYTCDKAMNPPYDHMHNVEELRCGYVVDRPAGIAPLFVARIATLEFNSPRPPDVRGTRMNAT